MKSLSLTLSQEYIDIADNGLLLHQQETVDALADYPIVMNCALTGAGKTRASHLSIQHFSKHHPVLYIAPTNALVSQHYSDAKAFVAQEKLPHHVVEITGRVLYEIKRKYQGIYRGSDALHRVICNPRDFNEIFHVGEKGGPTWLITNPDQVWMSIVSNQNQDARNLLLKFTNFFRFIVVDEFHYYTAEQLSLFFLCMALWKEFGQFDNGLKMLLLTATPDDMVTEFFQRADIPYATVGNREVTSHSKIPVLAPVHLTLTCGYLVDFKETVADLYNDGNDGVLISDSLQEINQNYHYYKDDFSVGRITGAIDNQQRIIESQKRLILATQTVDLGYNFIRPRKKDRQEIDFIVSTAYEKRKFWQRLGRAGRVLGRNQTHIPSTAYMLFQNPSVFKELTSYAGQTLSRKEISQLIRLDDKRMKIKALTREGLFVVSNKLREIKALLPRDQSLRVDRIFQTLKNCFDPGNLSQAWESVEKRHWLCDRMNAVQKKYPFLKERHIQQFLQSIDIKSNEKYPDPLQALIYSWIKNYYYRKGKYDALCEIEEQDRLSLAKQLLNKKPSLMSDVIHYFQEQIVRLTYLFNFRGSGQSRQIWVYDPERLHSESTITQIDVVDLISRYELSQIFPYETAKQMWHISLPKADYYVRLIDFHPYTCQPTFRYTGHVSPDQKSSEHDDVDILPGFWRAVFLYPVTLEFPKRTPPIEFKPYLENVPEFFFITPMGKYQMKKWLQEYRINQAELIADNQSYSVVYGKEALMISEELYYRHIMEKEATC
jgi:CRISPR-associated endonuclease/helicase Cas3